MADIKPVITKWR